VFTLHRRHGSASRPELPVWLSEEIESAGGKAIAVATDVRDASFDYARQGVRVNALTPGTILTEHLSALPEEQRRQIANWMPMGRPGNPEEVASAVAWLLSDQSSFITGAAIPVDGGKLAAGA
jgi:NAD(P)-dependent dehydrogenase (short-subunit alcohol dehydrogenase family)